MVHLTFWSWASGSKEAVARWNATHPSIQVTFDQIPSGGYSKILDAFKAGHEPDTSISATTCRTPSSLPARSQNLNSYLTPVIRNHYLRQAMTLSSLGGTTWGLPYDVGAQVMYYRADLFKSTAWPCEDVGAVPG